MGLQPFLWTGILWATAAWAQGNLNDKFQPTLQVSGYTQFRGTFGGGVRDEFRVPRARLTFSGKVQPTLSYKLMVDLADQSGKPLRDGYLDITFPAGQLRLGQFKAPMSLEYLTSSSTLDVINRTQVVNVLAPQRDLGLQYSGQFPRGEFQIAVINGEGVNARDANDQKDVVGRVEFHPCSGGHLGISYWTGRGGQTSVPRKRIGLEARYTCSQIDAWAEYLAGKEGGVNQNGWFLLVAQPTRSGQTIRPFARYEQFEPNDTVAGDRENILTLGATWFFAENAKVLLNYERHDPKAASGDHVILFQGQVSY